MTEQEWLEWEAEDPEEAERAWRQLGMSEFLKGYAESDSMYDDFPGADDNSNSVTK